jgi:hypothetical protein
VRSSAGCGCAGARQEHGRRGGKRKQAEQSQQSQQGMPEFSFEDKTMSSVETAPFADAPLAESASA